MPATVGSRLTGPFGAMVVAAATAPQVSRHTMAAPAANIEAMPVVRDIKDFDLKSGNRLERLIFNNRTAVMLACLVITIVLGFMAAKVSLNASYEKMLPIGHPYIQNYAGEQGPVARARQHAAHRRREHAGRHLRPRIPRHAEARSTTSCS